MNNDKQQHKTSKSNCEAAGHCWVDPFCKKWESKRKIKPPPPKFRQYLDISMFTINKKRMVQNRRVFHFPHVWCLDATDQPIICASKSKASLPETFPLWWGAIILLRLHSRQAVKNFMSATKPAHAENQYSVNTHCAYTMNNGNYKGHLLPNCSFWKCCGAHVFMWENLGLLCFRRIRAS